jgi:hypothetical protein
VLAAAKEIHCLEGGADGVCAVALAPGGRTLAAGYDNTIVLLWDVTGLRPE